MSDRSTRDTVNDQDVEFEDNEFDWESAFEEAGRFDPDASVEDEVGPAVVVPRNPDQLKVLATASLVILAFIAMLSAFYFVSLYLILLMADAPWVEAWMMYVSAFISVAVTGLTWSFVKNSVDRA